jgi:hypothetical protein
MKRTMYKINHQAQEFAKMHPKGAAAACAELKRRNLCDKCGKVLQKRGDKRQNGKKNVKDWDGRTDHVKCWKEEAQMALPLSNHYPLW